jgi:hypothetical protein
MLRLEKAANLARALAQAWTARQSLSEAPET